MEQKSPVHVLIVAGSDSSGGAGIGRDLETLGELGLRGAVAVTAVTVQTDVKVEQISAVAPDLVAAQISAAFRARTVGAVKIGMLPGAGTITAIAGVLRDHADIPVVLDPVVSATSGTAFLDGDAIAALNRELLPLCGLVTPNLPELAILSGAEEATSQDDAIEQARTLQSLGAQAVLVKGGHGSGNAVDILVTGKGPPVWFEAERVSAASRGTGCMLSTATAAQMAHGLSLDEACRRAKTLVRTKLTASRRERHAAASARR